MARKEEEGKTVEEQVIPDLGSRAHSDTKPWFTTPRRPRLLPETNHKCNVEFGCHGRKAEILKNLYLKNYRKILNGPIYVLIGS